ncbi:hypothetical protein CcaverHIS002_0108950 [Cutaneotrichosporon cavernicola]|uniref:Zn(2)-C6 fungal-type domain-containing protein n=1 Tax=Cutaneotrichosporon cavernicola TaxID=279322 RepID=A0AA48I6V8_9TREE|nr:uncharacterized protein CcaverHIS019_0108880 [Cutaneotrichosporon cavernicola]BEI80366.1 hypothetical protein CcaverHIS002_0108950 [Cutaneotrichosporon cavernicola]BEI88170.1 hypothetical protein CcaverHIS019_0108880 [Cutaneotrichosporon cavernicola]BEI95941.1 hypothetical protein CcaverHIS631_0108900 [Cutaneotrichosporon cavernicola]BEJ03716.1 hypothetical protein CcaverHIS641_0108910 [Cutaneotrichosporon cavernicola]
MAPPRQGQSSAMYKYLQDDSNQTPLKKVKCQRACKFCRKSHTTCEDTRPCQRCIKRDIAHLCLQDEADQLAQQAAQQQQQQLAAATAVDKSNPAKSTIPAKRRGYSFEANERPPPDRRTSLPQGPGGGNATPQFLDGSSAGPAGPSGSSQTGMSVQTPSPNHPPPGTDMVSNVSLPSMIQSPQDSFRSGPMSGFDQEMASPLSTTGRIPQWYDPAFQTDQGAQQQPAPVPQASVAPEGFSWSALVDGLINPLQPQSPSGEFAWLNANTANTPNGRGLQPNSSAMGPGMSASPANSGLKNESPMSPDVLNSDGPVMPYNYTFGYSRLKSWANSMAEPVKVRVNAATDKFKPILHSCLSQYSEEQIISVEVQFLAFVRNWATFCDTIPAPACIWRRTGEIYAANRRMLALMDMSPQSFHPGKSTLYNALDPMSFMEYWEDYGGQVLHHLSDRSNFDTVVPVAMANRPGEKTHLLISNMVFDTIGLPLVATAVLTPLRPPTRPPAEPTIDVQMNS